MAPFRMAVHETQILVARGLSLIRSREGPLGIRQCRRRSTLVVDGSRGLDQSLMVVICGLLWYRWSFTAADDVVEGHAGGRNGRRRYRTRCRFCQLRRRASPQSTAVPLHFHGAHNWSAPDTDAFHVTVILVTSISRYRDFVSAPAVTAADGVPSSRRRRQRGRR